MLKKLISIILIYTILFSNFSVSFANETTIPDILITFQNPSYLIDKDQTLDIYHCDTSKTECKVNFDLRDTFWWYVGADYACENNFSFTTWEETNCNPNTIIFPDWNSTVTFKIYEKETPSNYKEKIITIINNINQNNTESWETTNSWSTNSGIIDNQIDSGSSPEWQTSESWSLDTWTWWTDTSSGEVDTWIGITDNLVDSEPIPSSSPRTEGSPEWQNSESWSITGTGSDIEEPVPSKNSLQIPDVEIEIQSWLDFSWWIYSCKNTDCKINLNLEKLFTWTYSIANYACSWDFWSGTFTTIDTDKKCNPWYVNFWVWNHIIKAKIYDKWNENNFKTWSLSFRNWIVFWDNSDSWITDTNSEIIDNQIDSGTSPEWQDNTETWIIESIIDPEINSGWLNIFPSIILAFQNPSYLLDKDPELSEYICDTKESECKINFDLSESFSWFTISHYICEIDLPFENTESGKCNPSTINFPIWETEVWFKIYEKDNINNFTWKTILIKNEKIISSNLWSSWWWSSYIEPVKEIVLQSWANKRWNNSYECSEEICKINLKYEKSYNDICLWDFSWWNYKEKYLSTCNPWTLYYPSWTYNINLKVFKNWNLWYFESKNIALTNKFVDLQKAQNIIPTAKIKLQWTIWKNKELIWNKLICKNSKTCVVNFDWSESRDGNNDNLEFFWDFWNWETSDKLNPKSIEYTPWKYKITLKVVDKYESFSEDYFYVEVYEKEIKEEVKINETLEKYIKIIEALPNPIWKENSEWIKIKNDSINFINIKWLEIDDKIWSWSKSFTIKDDLFLFPFEERKLYKSETNINLNNSFDEVNLIYNDKIIDSLSWNYEVPEWFVVKKDQIKEKVEVIEVIDWDTIVIKFLDWKKEKLRFIWVDTPETKHPKKEVEFYWKEASDFTKSYLLWKTIYLELDKENYRDKYGRLLGYVWISSVIPAKAGIYEDKKSSCHPELDSESIICKNLFNDSGSSPEWQNLINFNKHLIEKWFARAYLRFPFKYSEEFEKAEKEARKNKVWMWINDEIIKEMKILEKLEKEADFENQKLFEVKDYKTILWNISNYISFENFKNQSIQILSFWKVDEKPEKEIIMEFDNLLKETLTLETPKNKIVNENKKIISYKTSKLKSWLKITWVTYPDSTVILKLEDFEYKTTSDKNWNYTFLLTDNLKVWEYELHFLVSNNEVKESYIAPRKLNLSTNYIFWVQDYLVKQMTKKSLPKKISKKKTKTLTKLVSSKKIKYEIESIKKEASKDETSTDKTILIFLITLLVWILWVILINKID